MLSWRAMAAWWVLVVALLEALAAGILDEDTLYARLASTLVTVLLLPWPRRLRAELERPWRSLRRGERAAIVGLWLVAALILARVTVRPPLGP